MNNLRECSVLECGKPVKYRGLCGGHYKRLLRYGDPLAGGPMRGDTHAFLEFAVNEKTNACIEWPYGKTKAGYGQVVYGTQILYAHRAMCERAYGPAPTTAHESAHSCGNPPCINPRHLSWKTHAGNMADTIPHGTSTRGERSSSARLTQEQALKIRDEPCPQAVLAERFGVTQQTVSDIKTGKTWRQWLDSQPHQK